MLVYNEISHYLIILNLLFLLNNLNLKLEIDLNLSENHLDYFLHTLLFLFDHHMNIILKHFDINYLYHLHDLLLYVTGISVLKQLGPHISSVPTIIFFCFL